MMPTHTILIGAIVIGIAVIAARLIAPYQIARGVDAQGNPFLWRSNAITGDVQMCPALNVIRHTEPKCQ
jgi:hypothetical protein